MNDANTTQVSKISKQLISSTLIPTKHSPILKFLILLMAVLSLCGCSASLRGDFCWAPVPRSQLARFVPVGKLAQEATFGDYTVRTYRDEDLPEPPLASFEILRNSQRVFAQVGYSFKIGLFYDDEPPEEQQPAPEGPKPVKIHPGQAIVGDGMPNLVISEWNGGAHCCFFIHVFQIGPAFRQLATIDDEHSDTSYFADPDGNGVLEFVTWDWAFAYWRTSFAYSPAPQIILRYKDGAYRLAADLMRQPPPSDAELQAKATALQHEDSWCNGCDKPAGPCPPSELWQEMLDLIYAGNAASAWRFFDLAWAADCPAKTEFLRDFRSQLTESTYWNDLKALNGGKL